ncbi:acrosomal vesicle protein 1 [Rattus norvegicus]|uniref:Acrosomal vesicle protein 1 n=2 Tax=Rattus norvegicus TaxID=10116 RepID=A6KRN3_RAT|nr:acrosomal protein SP-10 precursor [Rattus norvegicus]EDL84043.1 acrosomal vesicle protein 1 [Rattus norvegicus]CAB46086.1 sperm protein 10 [Rattus norvegicus]|eukprot:NP_068515.1 acrosomal protein SP-10 precursor [Rattus norvegicus]
MKELILLGLYLLGSSRGAPPGQPDELLDSVDQASVQQLSSEYFSLANPSDAKALYETASSEKTLSGHSSSEHESSEHTVTEHSAGEHSSGEQSSEHISSEHMSGEHLSEHTSGEHASTEHTSGEHTSGEHTSSEQLTTEQSSSDQSSDVSSGEQVSGEKLEEAGEQVSGEDKGNEVISTPLPSTSSGGIINCHTCAYMNEDAKCLRGEGICTTQNSQQCMLKKIYEGGKLQFMVQGCENMCPSMNLFSHGTRMQIMCCRHEALCNKA